MAKYSPKTRDELEELISDLEVNLGDIDISAIDDMSGIFYCICDRDDFSGIEKWDISNVENIGSAFEGLHYATASAICESLKKAYLVWVDEDNEICEICGEYTTRLEATCKIKHEMWEKYGIREKEYWEYYRAIGYQPKISDDDWDNLIIDENLDFDEVDFLLQNGLGVAVALQLDESGIREKVLGVYPSRIEALNANMEAVIPLGIRNELEAGKDTRSKIECLGYQPPIDLQIFIGKTTHYMQTALHGVNWARNTTWWLVEADSNDKIVNIVETFYSDKPEYGHYFVIVDKGGGKYILAETKADDSGFDEEMSNVVKEFSTDKKPNPNNHFVMIESSFIWEDRGWYDDECDDEDWDDDDE